MDSYFYHFTKIENLNNIMEKGLVPMNGENSKLVGDSRTGICVSLDILGAVVFSARFWYKMMFLYHDEKIAKKHFYHTIFLKFKADIIEQKEIDIENFSQFFIKTSIPSEYLKVCYLIDSIGNIDTDRFKVMLYMMKTVHFPNQINTSDFPYKALVEKLYQDLKEDLANFNEKDYQLLDMPLLDFLNHNFNFSIKK